MSLQHAVLRVKVLDMGEPRAMLATALDPPNLDAIGRAIVSLKEIGALTLRKADGIMFRHSSLLHSLFWFSLFQIIAT